MKILTGLLLMVISVPAFSEIPLSDFARTDLFSEATLSPDGAYLALRVPVKDQTGLAFVNLATKKIVKVSAGEGRSIRRYHWAGSRRVVGELEEEYGSVDYAIPTGELFAVDVDGKNDAYIFGLRGGGISGDVVGSASFVRSLPDDPEHVVIAVRDWRESEGSEIIKTYRLNVHNGGLDQEIAAPVSGDAQFLADRQGFVRYAAVEHEYEHLQTFTRSPEKPEWKSLNEGELRNAILVPLALSKDSGTVYLDSDEGGEYRCLVKQDLVAGTRVRLACEAGTDLADSLFSFDDDNEPIAAVFEGGIPKIRWLNSRNPSRRMLEALQDAFPGARAWPVSRTLDGSKVLVEVDSDRNPGDYYLFDTHTQAANFLISKAEWFDPEQMAEQRPIEFDARDGLRLHGFLTVPKGADARNQPMVVLPHGGPFGVRDTWYWDEDAQMLASRGYTVLQVNFRGSGGYGKRFERAGMQSWDHAMVDDITDGTHWAIAQGYADSDRICIFGASYGGYAALMSAVREPNLYRCAIGYAGIYDLERWKRDSDVGDSKVGRTYISDFVGAGAESLRAASPIIYLDRLKAAVMIVHGEEDTRAPFNQAKLLRDALIKRGHPFEWLVRAGEGHGFVLPKNRLALNEQLIAFLDKNIGPKRLPPAAIPLQP